MHQSKIHEKKLIRHIPTGHVYQIQRIGGMRMPNGDWVKAARYVRLSKRSSDSTNPESDYEEYYRAVTNFENFEAVNTCGDGCPGCEFCRSLSTNPAEREASDV